MTIRWLSKKAVLAIHNEQLKEHGGLMGIRDEGLLDSALSRPKNRLIYKETKNIMELASSYGFAIVRNHPFIDGNKRTAFVSAATFLFLNGYQFQAPQQSVVEVFTKLAASEIDEDDLTQWFKKYSNLNH